MRRPGFKRSPVDQDGACQAPPRAQPSVSHSTPGAVLRGLGTRPGSPFCHHDLRPSRVVLKGKARGGSHAKGHFSDTGVTPSLGTLSLPLPRAVLGRPLCAGHRHPWEPGPRARLATPVGTWAQEGPWREPS